MKTYMIVIVFEYGTNEGTIKMFVEAPTALEAIKELSTELYDNAVEIHVTQV